MTRTYDYIGPENLKLLLDTPLRRVAVEDARSVLNWLREAKPEPDGDGAVTVTFIVDTECMLWITDRRSEHVGCALGLPVFAAGEMSFVTAGADVEVVRVTNQSTGYCPEPTSWPMVDEVLDRVGLSHPTRYTQSFVFRLCHHCASKNIVKEETFECAVCGADLDRQWNFPQHDDTAGG